MDKVTTPIVLALIKDEANRILIAKRNDPKYPNTHGKWELVGGKIDWEETPEQAVVREAKEESGLDVELVKPDPKVYSHIWNNPGLVNHKVLLLLYTCRIVGGKLDEKVADREIAELKFISPSDITDYDCMPLIREMVAEAEDLNI